MNMHMGMHCKRDSMQTRLKTGLSRPKGPPFDGLSSKLVHIGQADCSCSPRGEASVLFSQPGLAECVVIFSFGLLYDPESITHIMQKERGIRSAAA